MAIVYIGKCGVVYRCAQADFERWVQPNMYRLVVPHVAACNSTMPTFGLI